MDDVPLNMGFTLRSSVLDHTSFIIGGQRLADFGTIHSCDGLCTGVDPGSFHWELAISWIL